MKKVVLLTGALAAGLAATSLNANASVPVAPNVQETNASDQQVAEMTYDKYHASVDVAIKWLYDLEVEFKAADIDADAKQEILKDIEKRSLELSGYTEDMENAWHNYEVDRENATNFAALQTALNDVAAKLASKEVVFPTETQIKTNLRDRYYHIAKDWKIYKDNVTRGNKLLTAFQDLMDDQYKQIDEIEDVKAAKKAVEEAHEKFRLDNKNFHADRWFEQNPKNWEPVSADHGTKPCCTDKEADLETLYQTLVGKKNDFETLLNKYYTAKETLTSKLATSNQAETAALTADPATYTQSVDGKAWVKAAQQKVNDAQKAADDFIKTYNAANPTVWSNQASVDQLKGEDGKAPAFKKESEYERRANELITAVDNAIKDLDAAVKEAKANEKAYQDGLTALKDRQKELDDIKTAYADKNKEFTTGKVYEQVIKAEQDKINNAKTDLTTAWNTWTDKTLVPVDPKNAVEHVAGVTKDNVIYGQLKQDIADLLTKIQKNEAANDKIHLMTEALKGHYTEVKNAVAGYEDVALSQYAADGLCAHGEYLGTTSLDNLLNKFIEDEQKKYDAIQSDAYLADTTENGPTAKKDALDHELEMTWNAIATDQCAKYLAKVEAEYNTKHAYCEGLDDVCNEVEGEGAPCTCTEEDREANPCGWCDATARGMHDAIETAKSEMDGNIQDWHFATDAKNHVAEVKTYKDKAFTDIENWVNAFKDADRLHDKNLDDLKVVVDKAVHNVHELYADARHDLDNYKEADLAAANLWAQDKYGVDFKGYVQLLEELYETAQVAADDARAKHHFTDLKAVGTECDKYATESDYRDAVKKNTVDYNANESVLGDLETRLASIVLNDKVLYGDDHTTLDTEYQRIAGLIDTARADASTAYNAGKAGEYTVPAEIATAIANLQVAVKNAEILYAANVAAKAELNAQLDAFQATVNAIELNEDALYADDYTTLDSQLGDLNDAIDTVRGAIDAAFGAKTAPEYSLPTSLAADLAALQVAVKNAENLHAANVAAKAELNAQLDAFQATVNAIELNEEALYADDYTTLDGQLGDLNDAIDTVRGEIDAAFNAKTAPEYSLPTTLASDLAALQVAIKNAENLYAANVAARTELYGELKDAETLLASVMVDAHQVYGDDFTALDNMVQAIRDLIDAEPANIEQAFNEKVATEYVLNAEIGSKIINLQTAVKDYEEFLRDNRAKAVELTGELNDLLVILEAMHKYGDVYPEDKVMIDYLLDNDNMLAEVPAGVKAAVLGLVERVKAEVANVGQDLADGLVQSNYENYKDAIDYLKADIEDLKQVIADAETLYAENLRALNNLEEHYRAVLSDLNEEEGNSKCELCDKEEDDTRDQLISDLNEIFDDFTSNFNVEKNLNQIEVYADFEKQLNDIEAGVKELKKSHEDHYDLVKTSQKAADNILDKLFDFNELFWGLEKTPGYENFVERSEHCSNPDVLYVNELKAELQNLKETVQYDNSHEGGHAAFENYNVYLKWIDSLKTSIETTKAAIEANEAAYALINERYGELYDDALAAYNFWHQYYAEQTLNDDWYTANKGWIQEWDGELEAGDYLVMVKNYFDDLYQHGNAANAWTVDAQGKELNDAANETFEKQDTDLAKDRNDLAHTEALNHYNAVRQYVDYEYQMLRGEYDNYDYWTDTWTKDPFTADVMDLFLDEIEGEFGIFASLNTYLQDIEAAYAEGVMEDAINIDERNHALGIHQQLGGVKSVFNGILAEYKDLFEDAHHLTNGKKIYSDQEYFTLGFFKKANDGSVENGQEMFKEVKVLVNDDIRLYDSRAYVWNDMGTPDDWSDDEALVDEKGRVVYDKENNPGEIAEVTVLTVGQKSNELSFNFHQNPMAMERTTLKAGTAEVDFLPGSISVKNDNIDTWVVKHTVSIDGIDVLTPEVAEMEITPYAASNKLIVRLDAPIDLTYTINSLVARTDDGTEFSYADRELNYAARTIEFTLPEGTASVELPEGFFTFRTGENTIARSAAMTVTVGTATSIEGLIAMGDKAQIFDLQGRRVKAEALISGNTYVVNGEKVMVK